MAKNMGDWQPPGRRRRLGKEVKGFRDGRIEPTLGGMAALCSIDPTKTPPAGSPPPVLAPANPLQKQVAESIMNDPVMKGWIANRSFGQLSTSRPPIRCTCCSSHP